jgi:hypothetical protein
MFTWVSTPLISRATVMADRGCGISVKADRAHRIDVEPAALNA